MRITRLHLRNYRVYEEPVDLELPPGLVGIYGSNGSGKSTLLEAIRFALYGKARTRLDEVRTADVKADCVAEVEFEHEGHLYVVRRTITGAGSSVKALATADGKQVAEGAKDTGRYVHSVLGMDDNAFRASVFAEQKQLTILSQKRPEERRQLVLQLLGVTPVDAARDRARGEARHAYQHVERMLSVLPDLDAARAEAEAKESAAVTAREAAEQAEQAGLRAEAELEQAEAEHERLEVLRREHDQVRSELEAERTERERAARRAAELERHLEELDSLTARLAPLDAEAAGAGPTEERLQALRAVAEAEAELTAAGLPEAPETPDEAGAEADREAADAARRELAGIDGQVSAAVDECRRATEAVERASSLSVEGACPLCGQALGGAFAQVQAHRAADLAEVEGRLAALRARRDELERLAREAAERAAASRRRLLRAREATAAFESARGRRAAAEAAVQRAREGYAQAVARWGGPAGPPDPAELPRLERAALGARKAAEEAARLRGRLESRSRLAADLESERVALGAGDGRVAALAEKLAAIGFVPADLERIRAARDDLRRRARNARQAREQACIAAASAAEAAEGSRRRVADAERQHAESDRQRDEARHLQRVGDLLGAFRNGLVATVGPRLSANAASLFAELTDHEYDDLAVDPETYEIRVHDRGRAYGMDRFSGSETDLANLAFRVAISEHVQFQSGGMVGLLVLDEVFGPLDDERKERMLLALERLRARFRQVLVVTHDAAIKEQLPNAVGVVKLPGRRAAVQMLT